MSLLNKWGLLLPHQLQVGKDYKVHFADRLPNALRPADRRKAAVFSGSSQILGLLASSNWRDNRTAPFIFYTMVIYWVLGGGFKYFFMFTPYLGKIFHFDKYFSKGLVQPPTSGDLRIEKTLSNQAVIHEFSRDQDGEAFFFFIACQMMQLAPKFDWNSASFEASNFHKE